MALNLGGFQLKKMSEEVTSGKIGKGNETHPRKTQASTTGIK